MNIATSSTTVLYIPGMYARKADLAAMRSDIGGSLGKIGIGFDLIKKEYGILSVRGTNVFTSRISREIRRWFATHTDCESIVLAGHSFGGMFARRVWLDALASNDPLDKWSLRVRGFVLVGSPDRGVDLARLPRSLRILSNVLYGLGIIQRLLLWEGTQGSRFVTDLRLDWIANTEQYNQAVRVAHILGTDDGLVARTDCLDDRQFIRPIVINLPGADHCLLARPRKYHNTDLFLEAWSTAVTSVLGHEDGDQPENLVGTPARASDPTKGLSRSENDRSESIGKPEDEKTIVFLLHGIRANHHGWPQKLKAQITSRHPDWIVVVPSYGYFTALRFALPWLRSRPVNWFKDQYTTLLDKHRHAVFHFVGHSNGTYAFGKSAMQCRGIRFDRVCLIGSVLPTNYDLDGLHASGRIGMVRVDCSSRDWPVGLFCAILSGLGGDVGVAGVRGFEANHTVDTTFRFHDGGHRRPLEDDHLPLIVDFLDGQVTPPRQLVIRPAWWLGWPSRFLQHGIGVWLVIVTVIGVAILPVLGLNMLCGLWVTCGTVLVVSVALVVWLDTM